MKDYNGFSGAQRDKAQRWLNLKWSTGELKRPFQCVACSQDRGVIDAHAEDYSEPFRAGVTDGFHLCFVCHMMVHCRKGNSFAWQVYHRMVAIGGRSLKVFTTRDFGGFRSLFLASPITPGKFLFGPPPERDVLGEIELSQDQVAKRLGPGDLPVTSRE